MAQATSINMWPRLVRQRPAPFMNCVLIKDHATERTAVLCHSRADARKDVMCGAQVFKARLAFLSAELSGYGFRALRGSA